MILFPQKIRSPALFSVLAGRTENPCGVRHPFNRDPQYETQYTTKKKHNNDRQQ